LAEARPLAFKPPFGFLPSFRVHAGDLAIEHRSDFNIVQISIRKLLTQNTFAG
jgi:hypothetical protein